MVILDYTQAAIVITKASAALSSASAALATNADTADTPPEPKATRRIFYII